MCNAELKKNKMVKYSNFDQIKREFNDLTKKGLRFSRLLDICYLLRSFPIIMTSESDIGAGLALVDVYFCTMVMLPP